MYQLLEDILPWLLGFYVLDSVVFQASGEALFVRPFGAFSAARGPYMASLLPWAEVVTASAWPLRFSISAVYWPEAGGFAAVSWEHLGLVERTDRALRSAGRSLRLPSPEDARRLAALLAHLRDTPAAQREAELAAVFRRRSDVAGVRGLREQANRHRLLLSALGSLLLLGLFVGVPLGLDQRLPFAPDLATMLTLIASTYVGIIILGWRVLRGCGLPRAAAMGTMASLIFLPATAGHARSVLARRLYSAYEPLAVAAVLLPPDAFRRLARETFHRLRTEAASVPEHARLAEEAWQRVVAQSGQQASDILSAPLSADPGAASYCPLCSAYYRPRFTDCSDCRVGLLPLGSAA